MDPYVGEIRLFAGKYAPEGWLFCNGQTLPVQQYMVLFTIIGTTYGGDGRNDFALPNMQGQAPMHQGAGPGLTPRRIGQSVGVNTVTLSMDQLPAHSHLAQGSSVIPDGVEDPTNAIWCSEPTPPNRPKPYTDNTANLVSMNPLALNAQGGNAPHNNMQPYHGLNFIICYDGIFPVKGD